MPAVFLHINKRSSCQIGNEEYETDAPFTCNTRRRTQTSVSWIYIRNFEKYGRERASEKTEKAITYLQGQTCDEYESDS
jgi:hypothetical protein